MGTRIKLTGKAADNIREIIKLGYASNENEAAEVAILCYKYCKIDKTPEKCPINIKIAERNKTGL